MIGWAPGYNNYMLERHPRAAKEYRELPRQLRQRIDIVESAIDRDPRAPEFVRRKEQGWGRRVILVAELSHQGTAYRIGWELRPDGVPFVWMIGSHEGFYARLARRAGRD